MKLTGSSGRAVVVETDRTIIVRPIQEYGLDELTLKDLDEAVASELVLSLCIRRRDTHAGNKGYVDGVPVFFDHHIAFDEYGDVVQTAEQFFAENGDGGYASKWALPCCRRGRCRSL
jgi:hypothetical protein